jgi:hypothetical protein
MTWPPGAHHGQTTIHQGGAKAAAAGATLSLTLDTIRATDSPAADTAANTCKAPAILASYTAEDHRRRLKNIAACTRKIRKCLRKHLIADYLPAQCVYNMGEYPSRTCESVAASLAVVTNLAQFRVYLTLQPNVLSGLPSKKWLRRRVKIS